MNHISYRKLPNFFRAIVIGCLIPTIAPGIYARLDDAYYGTNYTVPFAHAYRALEQLGVDHRKAIDRDTYHMSRLGLNAFRLHLWDVELTDSAGNLLENEHLDLLDYLIASLEKRGIKIILTAQTNFGNGYPERNTDPNGAFSYDYEKCKIHDTPAAANAQERYLRALVAHRNTCTGLSYAEDSCIMAIEINNEPCHSGSKEEITAYINRMAKVLRESGWYKDIIYNVSHNLWRTSAFFNADIDGTTYQWYPTGLVHGHERHGNFLPVLDSYDIPFDTVAGYERQPKLIYEYDPADVLATYLYPAAARTFRKAGFDWITQFAYDPVDMARFNSEYQTHFLNLAYTPGKAIGMAIAAEVTRRTPIGMDYGKYPADTIFGDFSVSARRNLAMLNDGRHYYHTNTTEAIPKDFKRLETLAGVGNSPLVSTDGLGAYFLDRLDNDVWRLEVMPDVILIADPFARPSLKRSVAHIADAPVRMTVNLPGLKENFAFKGRTEGIAESHCMTVLPGVYLLSSKPSAMVKWKSDTPYGDGNRRIGEFVMPPLSHTPSTVVHIPATRVPSGRPFEIKATVVGSEPIDSVRIFADDVNFWRDDNTIIPMRRSGKYEYTTVINPEDIKDRKTFSYNIVAYSGGKATTFPGPEDGAPLDWDFGAGRNSASACAHYSTRISAAEAPITLYDATACYDATDYEPSTISKYVGDIMACHSDISEGHKIVLHTEKLDKPIRLNIGIVMRDGFTYGSQVEVDTNGYAELPLSGITLTDTYLMPEPFPAFLSRTFTPDPSTAIPFRTSDIESVTVYTDDHRQPLAVNILRITIE